jgi:hypothetical protein
MVNDKISSIRADRKNYWMRNRSPQDPGNGFQEVIYQRALAIEMKRNSNQVYQLIS